MNQLVATFTIKQYLSQVSGSDHLVIVTFCRDLKDSRIMAEDRLKEFITSNEHDDAARSYNQNYGAHKVGISRKESAEYYTNWARKGTYDQDLMKGKIYNGPIIAGQALANHYPANRDKIEIIDIAAGTGYVGEELVKHGFKIIDALDPSEGMLDAAKEKNIYRKHICEFLNGDDVSLKENSYDCSVVSGGMGEGHIPCSGVHEMIRIVKPGGLVCIVMREEYLDYVAEYKGNLEPLMAKLEKEQKWKKISRDVVPNYSFNKNGIVFKFQVL